jgi:hypothetical protein
MIAALFASDVARAAATAAGGLFFGRLYFAALRKNVDFYGGGRPLSASALVLGRLVCAVMVFALVSRLGKVTLLTTFFGFLLARALAVRAARRII